MNDFIYFIISYILILLMGFMLINFLSNGFFGTFLRVKASRGKKVLVEVHSITDIYYKAGRFDGKMLKYTTRENKKKTLLCSQNNVFRKVGVFCVMADEINDNVIDIEFNAESGANAQDYDNLTQRIIMAPQIDNMKEKIILGVLILNFVATIIMGALLFTVSGQVTEMTTQLQNIASTVRVV